MVRIRLSRAGAKKKPYYHVVVADSRSKRDGKCIERVGFYNPFLEEEKQCQLNQERVQYWIEKGAKTSEIVESLRKKTVQGTTQGAIEEQNN